MPQEEDLLLDEPNASETTWPLPDTAALLSPRAYTVDSRATAEDTLLVGIVDRTSFTRECIATSLISLSGQPPYKKFLKVETFASHDEVSASESRFDIIVYHFHGIEGESLADLRKLTELAAVIVLSVDDSIEAVRLAFDSGARGYIPTTNTGVALLVEILHFVNAGGTFVPSSILARTDLPQKERQRLTEREMLILDLLKKGKQNKVIAYELGLSESTVKVHIRHILNKLRVANRTEAVSAAMQFTGNLVGKP